MRLPQPPAWTEHAACRSARPDLFHPHPTETDVAAYALAFCSRCVVAGECLDAALAQAPGHDWGIWGGTTRSQRLEMRSA